LSSLIDCRPLAHREPAELIPREMTVSKTIRLYFQPSLGIKAHSRISRDLLEEPFSLRSQILQFPSL
jgi:hypothetical protein